MGRSIDLVYLSNEGLVSVEFKLKDWRRGLRQASDHRIGADFSYLCLTKAGVSDKVCGAASDAGVGLLVFDETGRWPFRIALPAPRSQITSTVVNESLRTLLTND